MTRIGRSVMLTTRNASAQRKIRSKRNIPVMVALPHYCMPRLAITCLAIDAMAKRHLVYNHQVREVERKEKNGEVFVLRPPQALGIGRTEKDPKELRRVYELGRSEALKHLDEIRDFLSGKTEIKKEDMASRKKIRRHYHFIGTVQGVGFRFQAMMAADQLGLTGFVRNESDGSVTMEIQGEACEIDAAVEMINSGRFIHIEKTEVKEIPLKEGESSFSADYW